MGIDVLSAVNDGDSLLRQQLAVGRTDRQREKCGFSHFRYLVPRIVPQNNPTSPSQSRCDDFASMPISKPG